MSSSETPPTPAFKRSRLDDWWPSTKNDSERIAMGAWSNGDDKEQEEEIAASQKSLAEDEGEEEEIAATQESALPATQEEQIDSNSASQESVMAAPPPLAYLRRQETGESWPISTGETLNIGRDKKCNVCVNLPTVSRVHCAVEASESEIKLWVSKPLFIQSPGSSTWRQMEPGASVLQPHDRIRLVSGKASETTFSVDGLASRAAAQQTPSAGSNSFDFVYQRLLRAIRQNGNEQQNKKGTNFTLQDNKLKF